MGKLVKINNQKQITGEIIAYFQESITIPPMGSIWLLNMSCEMEEKNILISDDNNTFQRAVRPADFADVVMRNGLYNIRTFLRELNRALNASLRNIAGSPQGFQFKTSLSDRNLIKISFNRVPVTSRTFFLTGRTKWITGMIASADNGFTKNVANGWDGAVLSNKFFTNGAGAFTCRTTDDRPVIIGLVRSGSQANYDGVFDINAYDYCVYVARNSVNNANVYWCRHTDENGGLIDVETAIVAVPSLIGLMLSGGKLVFVQAIPNTRPLINSGAIVRMLEIDWEYDKSYYGMLSIFNNGASVTHVNFWNDPYHQITETYSNYHEEAPPYNMLIDDIDNYLIDDPTVGGSQESRVSIVMPPNVLTLLGFQANPPQSPSVRSGYFQGTRPYTNLVLPQNMKIILDNLAIESYDNVIKQHESILITIPSLVSDDGKFIYNAQFPLQIELQNKYALNMSEIRLRLTDFQRNLIKIKPDVTDITLIIS